MTPVLEIRGVTKSYGDRQVLKGIDVTVNELPDTLDTTPITPCMPPCRKSMAFPEPAVPELTWNTGLQTRFPFASIVTECARSRSNPIAIGVVPTVTGVLNVMLALIGPAIVFCITVRVFGSI